MRRIGLILALSLVPIACELTSTSITQPDDALLVEAYVIVGGRSVLPGTFESDLIPAMVFVHGIVGSTESSSGLPDVTVTITRDGVAPTELVEQDPMACLLGFVPDDSPGRCYAANLPAEVDPGDQLFLRVEAADGRVITGASTLPQDFQMITPVAAGQACQLPADTRLDITWTTSPGAWAYPSEVRFDGLIERLAQRDPQFADLDDPLIVFGLAISDSDTTISFPNEFGLFDRFDDGLLLRALLEVQDGLPDGTQSHVTIAAADRNWVNWERGGNFNPSGPVRVPSVSGDGFGVFGSMVLKTVAISVGTDASVLPACTGVVTSP